MEVDYVVDRAFHETHKQVMGLLQRCSEAFSECSENWQVLKFTMTKT